MTTVEPSPLDSRALADVVGGQHHGDARAVTRLCDPRAPADAAVVVWPGVTPDGLASAAVAGVAAVVTSAADEASAAALLRAAEQHGMAVLLVRDTRLALARLTRHFDTRPLPAEPGIHPSAVVHPSARLGTDVRLAPGSVVAAGAVLGDRVVLGTHASVGSGCVVGDDTLLFDRVVLYDGVRLGRRCRVHAGAVVGADGFGYAFGPQGAEKIHHLAGVEIGDDVEIGANACIDRGTLQPTRVGARCKLDNLVQVGHNVTIGDDVVIAGLSGLAGSARIGDRAILGGMVAIADHVSVGPDARLAGHAGVSKDVPAGETWGGLPAQPFRRWVRERYLIGRLETIWRAVRARHRDDDGP